MGVREKFKLFMSERKIEHMVDDRGVDVASAIMQVFYRTVVVNKELINMS